MDRLLEHEVVKLGEGLNCSSTVFYQIKLVLVFIKVI